MRYSLPTRIVGNCLLGLTLLAGSCQKDDPDPAPCQGDCTTISGRLTTGQAQVGLADAPVKAVWVRSNGLTVTHILKARTSTDADGRYSFSFHIEDNELREGVFVLYFNPDANRYYTFGPDRNSLGLPKLTRNSTLVARTYHFPRLAHVRLAITNPADLKAAGFNNDFSSSLSTCSGLNTVFSRTIQGGGPLFSWNSLPAENPLPVPGDQSVLFRSYKTKGGITTTTADSLFIPAGTTRDITVTY